MLWVTLWQWNWSQLLCVYEWKLKKCNQVVVVQGVFHKTSYRRVLGVVIITRLPSACLFIRSKLVYSVATCCGPIVLCGTEVPTTLIRGDDDDDWIYIRGKCGATLYYNWGLLLLPRLSSSVLFFVVVVCFFGSSSSSQEVNWIH